jgi:flagellar hook-associated protein 2
VLTARATGTSGAFTVTDLAGGAAAATGIGAIERAAANAAYTVDGVAATSESNAVDLAAGVHVTLTGTAREPTTVRVGPDGTALAHAVTDAAIAYTAAADALAGRYPAAAATLARTVADRRGALAAAGVAVAPDGHLAVDPTALATAFARDPAGVRAALGAFGQALRADVAAAVRGPHAVGAPAARPGSDLRRSWGVLGRLVDTRA